MFKNIIICYGTYIYCTDFYSDECLIQSKDLIKILKNYNNFTIYPKLNSENLLKYIVSIIKYKNNLYKLLLKNNYDEYIDNLLPFFINGINYNNFKNKIEFQKLIINYFKKIYVDKKLVKISSNIKNIEGNFIIDTIKKNNFKNTLEIGCAFGISAFYILSVKNTKLTSIDPFQKTQWNNNGINLLKEFDLLKNHTLIEQKSYEALPMLLKKYGNNSFDFIFIDGWHTFDYTLVDFFYANLLLKVNGIIIIDDALHNGVKKCVDYLKTNYLFYKKLESPITVACFKKIKDDNRDWNFHKNF
jgi:predicted O-methyltransferase YrrM